MKTLLLLVLLAIAPLKLFAADSLQVEKQRIPIRMHYHDGSRIPPQWINLMNEKDSDSNGWKFGIHEWNNLKNRTPDEPKYRNDPEHGSNGGVSQA